MKKLLLILPLTLILCSMVGCQDKAAMEEFEAMKAQAAVEEQNKEMIHNLYEQWNSRNTDALTEMHAPNAKYNHPSTGATPIPFEKALRGYKCIGKLSQTSP